MKRLTLSLAVGLVLAVAPCGEAAASERHGREIADLLWTVVAAGNDAADFRRLSVEGVTLTPGVGLSGEPAPTALHFRLHGAVMVFRQTMADPPRPRGGGLKIEQLAPAACRGMIQRLRERAGSEPGHPLARANIFEHTRRSFFEIHIPLDAAAPPPCEDRSWFQAGFRLAAQQPVPPRVQ